MKVRFPKWVANRYALLDDANDMEDDELEGFLNILVDDILRFDEHTPNVIKVHVGHVFSKAYMKAITRPIRLKRERLSIVVPVLVLAAERSMPAWGLVTSVISAYFDIDDMQMPYDKKDKLV